MDIFRFIPKKSFFYILFSGAIICCVAGGCRPSQRLTSQTNPAYEKHIDLHNPSSIKSGMYGDKIIEEAMTWLDTPYCYAAAEKGVGTDCSGMVLRVYEVVTGIKIPRNSAKQAEFCDSIGVNNLKIGDLAFFATGKDPRRISHVGIMIDSRRFIHTSTSKGVLISEIDSPYYRRTFRMFGHIRQLDE